MYVSTLNSDLVRLSSRCAQPDSVVSAGKAAVNQVFELLKRHSRYSIGRVFIFGSAGKKTAIASSDFDCVVFINNLDMSRGAQNNILQEFKSLLPQISSVRSLSEMTNPWGLQFTISGFEVDLLIAPNFVPHPHVSSDVAAEQASAVYGIISSSNSALYSPALCESAVRFMKEQSSFVHELVRLCKFWNESVNISGYVGGRSTLIELIAVHAGQEVERSGSRNKMYDGFLKFLSLIVNYSALRIRFDFDATKGRRSIHRPQFSAPFVVEPSNPCVNLAQNLNSYQQQTFVNKARETLSKLQQAQYSSVSINSIFP